MPEKKDSLNQKLQINQGKFIEALLCIFAFGYYFGVLRYYDIHTLINFNLVLLPNFFLPIGFSILIAIPLLLGLYTIKQWKKSSKLDRLDLENKSRQDAIRYLFEIAIYLSIVILVAGWFFSDISSEIALILGGIPLLLIFIIYLLGLIKSSELFKSDSTWKRLTLYLVVALTVAFSANGITVGLIYVLTFLYIEEGKVVVRTQFEEKLGYDAIQMIYNIQLLVAVTIIVICLILLKVLAPRLKTKSSLKDLKK